MLGRGFLFALSLLGWGWSRPKQNIIWGVKVFSWEKIPLHSVKLLNHQIKYCIS